MSRNGSLRIGILALVLACCSPPVASAATIDAGMHFLAPNMPGQQVPVFVTGGEAVSGVDLFVQVGDGGATVGGDDTGPMITNVDLLSGSIFAANHTSVFTDPAPLIWGATTTTASGTVVANGLLATLTIDTTGITTGQFDLILNPPATGPTAFADANVTTNLTNGWLRIGAAPSTPGDYNKNGAVDAADYVLWRDMLNQMGPNLAADGNGNNQVDAGDYQVWRASFGKTATGSTAFADLGAWNSQGSNHAAVPEPSNVVLLLLGLAVSLRRRVAE